MRVIFDEELKAVADDLDRMVQDVRKAINGAGDALLKQDVEAAQSVIDGDIEIDALESSVIDQCIRLLAKQNPVATDLRVVVSTLRLAATFERMGDLAKHIAEAARRIYPEPALPAEATELFTEMQQFLSMTADRIVVMLQDRDAKTAEEIILDDDKLDALHHKTFDLALSDKWTGRSTSCCSAASWSVLATTPCRPPAASCTSCPASIRARSRRATRTAPSSDDDRGDAVTGVPP